MQPGRAAVTRPRGHPVLLHGFTGSAAAWGGAVVDGLSGAGYPPVLVDLPGHGGRAGEADPACFTLDATLDVVERAGHWPSDVVGYSMGARIALHLAAARPGLVRRLVLESGSPGLETEQEHAERRAADEALARRIVDEGLAAFVDFWESQPVFESRSAIGGDVAAWQRALRLRNDARSLAASLVGVGTGALPSLWDELPRVTVPTLIVVGELDAKFVDVGERMARAMPETRLVVVPGAGHTVHLERPAAWLEAVTSFLS